VKILAVVFMTFLRGYFRKLTSSFEQNTSLRITDDSL